MVNMLEGLENKYGGNFVQVEGMIFPVRNGFGLDQLIGSSEVFGDTQLRLWGQGR